MQFTKTTLVTLTLGLSAVLAARVANGDTVYVDGDNTSGPRDGSPEHPRQYIQMGIDAATENRGTSCGGLPCWWTRRK